MKSERNSRLRILILNAALFIGGAEKVIASLALGLRAKGHAVTVCTIKGTGEIGRQLAEEGIQTINLADPESRLSVYTAFCRLAKIVRERQIDVVHTHTLAALWDAMLAKTFFRGARLIHTFHFGNYPRLPWQSRLMEGLALKRANRLVAVGFSQRSAIAQTYGIDKDRIDVVLNGVNRKEQKLDSQYWRTMRKRHSVLVGSVSTLIEQKGIDNLIRVAKSLKTKKHDFALIIAGDGPLRSKLEAQARDANLSDIVYFIGWVDEAASTVLPALDIFVQPSRWEAMSIVILEAMAAGIPVVATDVGDNGRVIIDERTGFIVSPTDEQEFANKLEILIQDTSLRTRMGNEASTVLQEHYSEARMIDSYIYQYHCATENI
jgi:glycosyltransferase involved in cell wall biosynthesis